MCVCKGRGAFVLLCFLNSFENFAEVHAIFYLCACMFVFNYFFY